MKRPSDDDTTTLATLNDWVCKFCEERAWGDVHTAKDLAIGLVTEASELLEIFRFRTESDIATMMTDEIQRTAMADELADSLFCLLRFADRHGFDLTTALADKLNKTARKYPPVTKHPAPNATR